MEEQRPHDGGSVRNRPPRPPKVGGMESEDYVSLPARYCNGAHVRPPYVAELIVCPSVGVLNHTIMTCDNP
jgi:hypothetical protein